MRPMYAKQLELARGFEPPTRCLQGSRSTSELRQHRQTFMLVFSVFKVKDFFPLDRSLAKDLIAEHSAGTRHVQGSDPSPHWKGYKKIARPRHQGSKSRPFTSEDQTDRTSQIGLPDSGPTSRDASDDPNPLFFKPFESDDQVCLPGHRKKLDGPHRSFRRPPGKPGCPVFGNEHAVDPHGLGCSEQSAQILGVLHLIQGQEESRLATLSGNRQEVLEGRILRLCHPRHDPLVVEATSDRGELLPRAVGDLHAAAFREGDQVLERRSPPRSKDEELLDAAPATPEQLQHGVPAVERRAPPSVHGLSFQVVPSGPSSTITPS